jgi:RNAse (barnase) inhibitor barstar
MNEQNILSIPVIPQINLEGTNIHDISSFYKEINRVFMQNEDWDLGESLDAFNDLLYGGFGILKGLPNIKLVWNDSKKCSHALGYDTTKAYYLRKLEPGSTFDRAYHEQKLAELETGNGRTYFEIILDIISEHPNIQLISS